jgi:SAM-dependent methyltransferase
MIGIVYYEDDLHKRVFRVVHPAPNDAVDIFDDPRWVTEGVDPERKAVLMQIENDDPRAQMTGTPSTPANDPLPVIVPWSSTDKIINAALDLAEVGPGDILYDLGSGTGVWLIAAMKRGACAVGIEHDSTMVAVSRKLGVTVIEGDFMTVDLSAATVITMNLGSVTPINIAERVLKGTRIIGIDCDPQLGVAEKSIEVVGSTIRLWKV